MEEINSNKTRAFQTALSLSRSGEPNSHYIGKFEAFEFVANIPQIVIDKLTEREE